MIATATTRVTKLTARLLALDSDKAIGAGTLRGLLSRTARNLLQTPTVTFPTPVMSPDPYAAIYADPRTPALIRLSVPAINQNIRAFNAWARVAAERLEALEGADGNEVDIARATVARALAEHARVTVLEAMTAMGREAPSDIDAEWPLVDPLSLAAQSEKVDGITALAGSKRTAAAAGFTTTGSAHREGESGEGGAIARAAGAGFGAAPPSITLAPSVVQELVQSLSHARDRPTDHGQSDSSAAKATRSLLYGAFDAIPTGGVASHLTLLAAASISATLLGVPKEPSICVVDVPGIRWPGYRSSAASPKLFTSSDASPIAGVTLSESATTQILNDALAAAKDDGRDLVLGGAQLSFAFTFLHKLLEGKRVGFYRAANGQWFPSSDVNANLHSPGTQEDAEIYVRSLLAQLKSAAPQMIRKLFDAAGWSTVRVEAMPSWAIIKVGLELMPACATFLEEHTGLSYRRCFGTLFGAFMAFGELVVYIAAEGRLVVRVRRGLATAGADPTGVWQLVNVAVENHASGPLPIPAMALEHAMQSAWGWSSGSAGAPAVSNPAPAPLLSASSAVAVLSAAVASTVPPAMSLQRESAGEHETGGRARGGHHGARGGRGGWRRPAAAGQWSQPDGADNAFFEQRRRQREENDFRRLEDRLADMERSLAEERRRNDAAPARGQSGANAAARGGAASGVGRR